MQIIIFRSKTWFFSLHRHTILTTATEHRFTIPFLYTYTYQIVLSHLRHGSRAVFTNSLFASYTLHPYTNKYTSSTASISYSEQRCNESPPPSKRDWASVPDGHVILLPGLRWPSKGWRCLSTDCRMLALEFTASTLHF